MTDTKINYCRYCGKIPVYVLRKKHNSITCYTCHYRLDSKWSNRCDDMARHIAEWNALQVRIAKQGEPLSKLFLLNKDITHTEKPQKKGINKCATL